jgi:hypothetical protein
VSFGKRFGMLFGKFTGSDGAAHAPMPASSAAASVSA